jgi:ribosomal protein L4
MAENLNTFEILKAKKLIFEKEAVENLEKRYK